MPKSKVWPEPLTTGTPVKIEVTGGSPRFIAHDGDIGFLRSFEEWKPRRFNYRVDLRNGGDSVSIPDRYVRPLDMSDPADVEVWLDE